MKKLIGIIKPPAQWKLPVAVLSGIFAGLAVYIFIVSNAASYISDDPRTCINCHIMNPQFASWMHSSHRETAICNDCHVPHNNIFNKYFFKAKDGMRHASMFTFRLEPQVIQIKEAGKKVVHKNCIRCHENLLILPHLQIVGYNSYYRNRTERFCWSCHQETPHGTVNSLSAFPNSIVPEHENVVPVWLEKIVDQSIH
ncbi:MAG: cytochrome c nitrite reductase small subunit [Bacteroidales bacterium]